MGERVAPAGTYQAMPSRPMASSSPVDVCASPASTTDERAAGFGQRITTGFGCVGHHRLIERRRIDDAEQFVDVDRLDRQAAAHDIVARTHQLDARAVQIGVEVASREVDRLAGLEHHVVEEQRGDDAGIAGVHLVQSPHPHGFRAVARRARGDGRRGIDPAAVQVLEHGARSVRPEVVGELGRSDLVEQIEGGIDRPHPAQRLELGERAQQFGLRVGVGVDAAAVAIDGLFGRGMSLQRERLGRGQDLEQVRQLARDRPEFGAVVEASGPVRVRAQPELGARLAGRLDPEQVGDERRVAPRVVLDRPDDPPWHRCRHGREPTSRRCEARVATRPRRREQSAHLGRTVITPWRFGSPGSDAESVRGRVRWRGRGRRQRSAPIVVVSP